MKIYQHINEIKRDPNTVLTIGTFDGIHLGHQEILKKLFERSRFHNARNFLITFHPHPRKVILKGDDLKTLSTPAEKALILEKMGLENLLIINFTKEFSEQSPKEFFRSFVIEKIGLREIVIGHDHKFGKGREGTSETLKTMAREFHFGITLIDEFKVNSEIISSTKIRDAILEGDIRKANSYLGREYTFSGKVVVGDKRGKVLGYPTANIEIDDTDKLLPNLGIYAANVIIDNEKFEGLLSIGKRPTFYDSGEIVSEVYIYNFERNIYSQKITVSILDKIRDEEKFLSPEALINQMNKDKEAGIKIFKQLNSSKKISKLEN
jgi:riboflavin kinase/FMN adenylyltransferase